MLQRWPVYRMLLAVYRMLLAVYLMLLAVYSLERVRERAGARGHAYTAIPN